MYVSMELTTLEQSVTSLIKYIFTVVALHSRKVRESFQSTFEANSNNDERWYSILSKYRVRVSLNRVTRHPGSVHAASCAHCQRGSRRKCTFASTSTRSPFSGVHKSAARVYPSRDPFACPCGTMMSTLIITIKVLSPNCSGGRWR